MYCQVIYSRFNSQRLRLRLDTKADLLIEYSDKMRSGAEIGDVVTWTLTQLRKRLLEKHAETFWIKSSTKYENSLEYFQYTEVQHTRAPILLISNR